MPTLKINNLRTITAAEAEIHAMLTLFAGGNRVGKSTAFNALRAVLLDTGAVCTGVMKLDGGMMLAKGAKAGFAQMASGESQITIQWPTCKVAKSKGKRKHLPASSEWAAGGRASKTGLQSLFDVPEAERIKAFSSMFACDPTLADLQAALKEAGVDDIEPDPGDEEAVKMHVPYADVWAMITDEGKDWDSAHKGYGEESRQIQAQWKEVTRRSGYGIDAGETWEAEIEASPAATAPEEDVDELQTELAAKKAEIATLTETYHNTPAPEIAANPHVCPRCTHVKKHLGTLENTAAEVRARFLEILGTCQLMFKDGGLIPYEVTPKPEVDKIRGDRAGMAGQLSTLQTEEAELQRRIGRSEGIKEVGEDAAKKAAQERTKRAADLHWEIQQIEAIRKVVAPIGVRKTAMEKTILEVTKGLSEVASEMDLPAIVLDTDLDATLGGTPYQALSESEQWMMRAILQLEIARYDNSELVLLDRFDVLLPEYRARMMQAIQYCAVPTVLFMSASHPRDVPDLDTANAGMTHWVGDGTIVPLAEALGEAKEAA